MRRIVRAFMNARQSVDDRFEEWLAALKEDKPMYPRDVRETLVVDMPRTRGAHRKTSQFTSFDSRIDRN